MYAVLEAAGARHTYQAGVFLAARCHIVTAMHCPEGSTGMMGLSCVQDFSAAFSRLLELGVPFPESAPAT